MRVDAVLIQQPAVNFTTFLAVTHEALGYSPAAKSDASHRKMCDAEKFISCLESLSDKNAAHSLPPALLTHVSFSVLIAADDRDILSILEAAVGMPFVHTETTSRGIDLLVVTGTLAQWRVAVISGSRREGTVQACYCKILTLFEGTGLNVWGDCKRKPAASDSRLFYLEDKR